MEDNNAPTKHQKNKVVLPLIALALDFFPFLLPSLELFGLRLSSYMFLFLILSPIAGLITGVIALSRGKEKIGAVGKMLALIAITIPLTLIAFIVILFIGVSTNIISFM